MTFLSTSPPAIRFRGLSGITIPSMTGCWIMLVAARSRSSAGMFRKHSSKPSSLGQPVSLESCPVLIIASSVGRGAVLVPLCENKTQITLIFLFSSSSRPSQKEGVTAGFVAPRCDSCGALYNEVPWTSLNRSPVMTTRCH